MKTPVSPPLSPVQPRKLPRQQRSIALVNALKDACLQILREEGPAALTVQRLSEVSGVAAVSMYEYFPTVDAVIAAAFRGVIGQLIRDYRDRVEVAQAATLADFLLLVATNSIAIRRELWHLHPALYTRYIEQFEAVAPEVRSDPAAAVGSLLGHFADQLVAFADEIRDSDLERAGFLALRALQMVTRSIALERPQYLDDPATAPQLARMLHGLLT